MTTARPVTHLLGNGRRRALRLGRPVVAALAVWAVVSATPSALRVQDDTDVRRIVSIVPAVTEMLFAMGAGSRVIGVSSFVRHPPAVERLARVGGLVDPDVERILALHPDLVVVYDTQTDLREQLDRASVPMYVFRHGGLGAVTSTIRSLGTRIDVGREADRLASALERRLADVASRVERQPRPRTLLVFDREPASLRGIFASGGTGFLHDMLETAGGINLFADVNRESVQVNTETLLARAPEVIVEFRYNSALTGDAIAREEASWNRLSTLPAVRNGRVHLLEGDAFVVPGPRIVDATERLARALHPDAFDERDAAPIR